MFSSYTVLETKIYLMINSLNSCDSRQISNLKIQKSEKACLEKQKKNTKIILQVHFVNATIMILFTSYIFYSKKDYLE